MRKVNSKQPKNKPTRNRSLEELGFIDEDDEPMDIWYRINPNTQ